MDMKELINAWEEFDAFYIREYKRTIADERPRFSEFMDYLSKKQKENTEHMALNNLRVEIVSLLTDAEWDRQWGDSLESDEAIVDRFIKLFHEYKDAI